MNVTIKALDYYLPEKIEGIEDLLDDNPQWNVNGMFEKIGITHRRIAAGDECASDLGFRAAQKLLEDYNIDRKNIDALIFCTQTPDYFLPTSACLLQDQLGLSTKVAAFDISLGCSGFVYGLAIGASFIESGLHQNVLLVCADTYTKFINKLDRSCRPLFSDAGAAALLGESAQGQQMGPFIFGTDGQGAQHLIVSGGGARNLNEKPVLKMNGSEVLMFTMSEACESIENLLTQAGKTVEDIDYFFFHQANKLVLDNMARHLSIPEEKLARGYMEIGNTVSASIPIIMKQTHQEGKIKKDSLMLLAGFGVGYSWGSCLVYGNGLQEKQPKGV